MRNVVLFDDVRSFEEGFCDEAIVLRTVDAAREFFEVMVETGFVIDELWLDYVLNPGAVTDALIKLPGSQVRTVFFHSDAFSALDLVTLYLREAGFTGEIQPVSREMFAK